MRLDARQPRSQWPALACVLTALVLVGCEGSAAPDLSPEPEATSQSTTAATTGESDTAAASPASPGPDAECAGREAVAIPPAQGDADGAVYLTCVESAMAGQMPVYPVPRSLPESGDPEARVRQRLEEWLAGPTASESAEGLGVLQPQSELRLQDVWLSNGVLHVDFDRDALPGFATTAGLRFRTELAANALAEAKVSAVTPSAGGSCEEFWNHFEMSDCRQLTHADPVGDTVP